MDARLLNESKFLKSALFGVDYPVEPTFTIERVVLEEEKLADGSSEKFGIIHFRDAKPMTVNVTNCKCLIAMFGQETNNWHGKRVTLYADRVFAFGEWTTGIRIRGSPDLSATKTVIVKTRGKGKKTKEAAYNLVVTGAAPSTTSPAPAPAAAPAQRTPWQRIYGACAKAGIVEAEIGKFVKSVTNKGTPAELVDEDVAAVQAALDERKRDAEAF